MTFTEAINWVGQNGVALTLAATTVVSTVTAVLKAIKAGNYEDGLKVATASIQAMPAADKAALTDMIQKVGKEHGVEDSVMNPLVGKIKAFLTPGPNPNDPKLESILASVQAEVQRKSRQTPPPASMGGASGNANSPK